MPAALDRAVLDARMTLTTPAEALHALLRPRADGWLDVLEVDRRMGKRCENNGRLIARAA